MVQPHRPRLPRPILRELEKLGRPWQLVRGTRHWRLLIDGHQIGVFSYGVEQGDFRSTENMRAHIRRFGRARELA